MGKRGEPLSLETRAKMAAAHKGKPHPYIRPLGIRPTEVTKSRIAEGLRGRKASDATRSKMSATRKGVQKSDETRRRMSEARKNSDLPGNRRRSEATSKRNVEDHLTGKGFLVKGHHVSAKALRSPVAYRSKNIELRLMMDLDADPTVLSWESPFTISYSDDSGVHRHALPDFLITMIDGSKKVVEGKGPHLLHKYLASEKFYAVKSWCHQNQTCFEVVSTSNRGESLVRTRIL